MLLGGSPSLCTCMNLLTTVSEPLGSKELPANEAADRSVMDNTEYVMSFACIVSNASAV